MCGIQTRTHGVQGSGHVSTDSLDMCEDYLDINVLMDAPVEAAAADWYSLQPI